MLHLGVRSNQYVIVSGLSTNQRSILGVRLFFAVSAHVPVERAMPNNRRFLRNYQEI